MGKKLYVGNLPFSATDAVLADTFAQCGKVESARVMIDRESGRSKGFGFVEMSTDTEAADAVTKFDGADYEGRKIKVNEARPMEPRTGGAGGFGGRPPRSGNGGSRDNYGGGGNGGGNGGGRGRY